MVARDIINLVRNYFKTDVFNEQLTDTNIVLVPNKQKSKFMTDMRPPISLCNITYKIVSKMIANKLKEVVGKIISEMQSALILRCMISDNIMISYEVMHYVKRKMSSKKG